MPVQPDHRAGCHGKKRAEGLIAPDPGRGDDEGCPVIHSQFGGAADGADLGRGVEGGTELVVQDARAGFAQRHIDRGQVLRHPFGAAAAGIAGNADGALARKAGQKRGRRGFQEEDRGKPAKLQHLHHRGRAGEIIAIPGDQWTVSRRKPGHAPYRPMAAASALFSAAARSSGMPAIAASQALRRLSTPPAGPCGCAMMPPPAAKIRSADPRAA